jgi:hypothetical protein
MPFPAAAVATSARNRRAAAQQARNRREALEAAQERAWEAVAELSYEERCDTLVAMCKAARRELRLAEARDSRP